MAERKIDTKLVSFADDVGLGKFDQWGVNLEPSPLDTCFRSDIGQVLKRSDKFRTAIGVAAVVDGVDADKNVIGRKHFGPRERIREEDGVARGNVCDWNSLRDFCFRTLFRNGDIVRERRAAEDAQVDVCNAVFFCA